MPLRMAIVGAGIMGSNHARLAGVLRDVEVTHIVDPAAEPAEVLARAVGARAVTDVEQVAGEVDLAVVAVPTPYHLEAALPLIERGVHLLVEKPLAPDVDEGKRLVTAAERAGIVLATGHVERFNPAVLGLDEVVTSPIHVTATRISAYSPRVRDGVVMDLMIHDLDIVRSIVRSEVTDVQAVLNSPHGGTEDLAAVVLRFANGATANLLASRVGQQKIRELHITQSDNFVSVDLLRQSVTINRVAHSEYLSSQGARYRQSGVVEIPFLEHRGEPLALELEAFVHCVRTGERPRVSGEDGLEAVRLAQRVLAAGA